METYAPPSPTGRLTPIQALRGASLLGAATVVCTAAALLGGGAVYVVLAVAGAAATALVFHYADAHPDDRAWEITGDGGPLAEARERRPHRGLADPVAVHTEYAVLAEDGRIAIYAFDVLTASEDPQDGAMLVMGRPRHQATRVRQETVAPADRGARLLRAQEYAAQLEARAAADARAARWGGHARRDGRPRGAPK
jgi:hypothetical protein